MHPKKEKTTSKPKVKLPAKLVVGVGASAGGLEAIYKLFNSPVPENVSFIIVQHLPSDYKSNTTGLLTEHSGGEVVEIKDNMRVNAGVIYVLSERKNMILHNDRIILREGKESSDNKIIDIFFNSLAENKGSKSVGVILSGANQDGTIGAAAIKKAGGIVIAQDPSTTSFGNMPTSVINSGCADMVLDPENMMEEIESHLENIMLIEQFTENDEAAMLEIIKLIKDHSPLDFTGYKRTTLIRRIIKRMRGKKFNSLPDYIEFLKSNPDEVEALSKEFLISVTSFFRDMEAYEILKEKALPEIVLSKQPDEPLKVWVVGCATGEEAYSLGIIIDEFLTDSQQNIEVKLFASDIDKKALDFASKGVYPKKIEKDLSAERLSRYFIKEGDNYKVNGYLRQMVIFAQHDVTRHPPYYKLDLISCRNLLIYLQPLMQNKILSTLHFCLNEGGYLFLGPSEGVSKLKENFLEVSKQWKIYKNIKPARNFDNGTYTAPSLYKQSIKPLARKPEKKYKQGQLSELINQALVEKLNYAGVCIDEDNKVLKTIGEYKKYLLPEMFNINLLELLPHELSLATATSLKKALKENQDIEVKQIRFKENEKMRSVDLQVKILPETRDSDKLMLVLFKESKARKKDLNEQEVFHEVEFTKRHLRDIEAELKETQQQLQETEDALEMSTDAAQAYNEELISNNEELQSTNEEVQSINEELQTVNADYKEKIRELADINDDLNNYFRSTTNSQLYVDRNLVIRKFTPLAFKQINLQETDIGRPLKDISTNIKFDTLMEDLTKSLKQSTDIEKEVQTLDDKWYQMRVTPYIRQQDNKTDGLIITFNDITELKKSENKLNKIIQDHDTFIHSVSHDLKNQLGNIYALSKELYEDVSVAAMDNEEIKKVSGHIFKSVKSLTEIITDLTDIAKIEKEIWEEHYEKINLNSLLKDIKFSIQEQLKESKAIIETDFQVPEIRFMKKNLRSILLNLLSNAIKYRSPERQLKITIRSKEIEDFILLSVQDNGRGISADKLGQVFHRFKRVHDESVKGIEGTGIGLYLVNKIVTNAGGKIEVSSVPGKGSTFTVCFKKD